MPFCKREVSAGRKIVVRGLNSLTFQNLDFEKMSKELKRVLRKQTTEPTTVRCEMQDAESGTAEQGLEAPLNNQCY